MFLKISKATRRATVVALFAAVFVVVTPAGAQAALENQSFASASVRLAPALEQTGKRRSQRRRTRSRTRRTTARRTKRYPTASPVEFKPREIQGVVVEENVPPPPTPLPTPTPLPLRRAPVSGGVLNGRAISLPLPPYPAIAKAAKASGTVVVQVLVGEDGNVLEARAISGHPLLRTAAQDSALQARFPPTQLSGQPVKVTGVITYEFVP